MHSNSDSFGKTLILFLIDHKKYAIDFTASIFNCSKNLKKAHKWKLHSVGIEFSTKNKITNQIYTNVNFS